MGKASLTGGVKPMAIAGRYVNERERLLGMTDAERAFRLQWLKDQELSANEPKKVPELYKATHNPIKRLYRWPLDQVANLVRPILGPQKTLGFRYFSGKAIMGVYGAYIAYYYYKYNRSDWTRKGGVRVLHSRVAVVEGDPGYPKLSDRTKPQDYGSRGFKNVTLKL